MLTYSYTVYVSTVQMLNGTVTVQSDHRLNSKVIGDKAIELVNGNEMHWERGEIAPDIDIDEIQTQVGHSGTNPEVTS